MLYGRNDEQARISSLIDKARDHRRSGVLVLRGEAGIGKSALLAQAADRVPRALRVTGIEAESGIAFAGLNQLLWPVRDRLDALPAPQAAALRSALGETSPGHDRFTTGLAVLTLLADLADADGPVVAVVDDAQWLDTATAEALLFAARRLAAEGVVMLFAARDDAFAATGLPELRLGRLPRADAERLLAARDLAPIVRDRVVREAAGNPLALHEFAAADARRRDDARPLPVTDRVLGAFQAQIGRLPEGTRLMLLIAAAEGRGHMPSLLGAASTFGVGLADLEEAERARLVEVSGRTIAFRHPLIRAAAYQGAVAARRLAVHRALAESADDMDCRARHRASAALGPDEDVAAELEDAAVRARCRTGYGTAAALYRQAADLTPDPPARAARLGAAADLVLLAGRLDEAEELAVQAEGLGPAPADRARLGRVHAAVEYERGDPRAAARRMVDRAAGDDRAAMLRTGAMYGWTSGELPAVLRAAELLPDDPAVCGLALLARGDHAGGAPLLAGPVAEALDGTGDRVRGAQLALIVGDDAAALELAAAEVADGRRHGRIGELPNVLQVQAQTQIAAGLHADAEATVAEAIALARDTGRPHREGRLRAVLARVAAIEGDEARLRELIAHAPSSAGGIADSALALLDLGLGRHDDALRRLEEISRGHHRHGSLLSAADQVEAAVRTGAMDVAREAHSRFSAWAEAVKQPWALAVSLHCEALLSDSEEPFVQAVRLHEQSGRPFERARTELLYGEFLRRSRRRADARGPLRSAVSIFERLRAAPWLDRARAELRATGESGTSVPTAPDLLDRLTPQELQVVRLAALGTSSREIAAQLFLSPRTVEYHLYKAYPKLGISSRRELSRLTLEPV
ncbi:regulatory protein, luxR family [Actinomadura madurae]|uniref:Regulatory protein, luxR family n=1 Tax=Actinomadura madurae TaxID=1993 RepID=A0A1I5GEX9_9ACTN|nr:helix-turn-helix transcriptional regulator [Actinomadura madurae]SFO34457.1 regulatory protein, luxR family [Actinomadura madurae]